MIYQRVRAGAAVGVLMGAATVGMAAPGAAHTAQPGQARRVAVLTGAESLNATEARYEVKGTDLGIMWTDQRGQILAAFGDTFGAGWAGPGSEVSDPAASDWRSNTLARSSDHDPSDGMPFADFVTDRPAMPKSCCPR
jgi:hypothetical protein